MSHHRRCSFCFSLNQALMNFTLICHKSVIERRTRWSTNRAHHVVGESRRQCRSCAAEINLWGKSGGFCCPAPPAAAEFPSVARWVQPRSFWVMSGREAINYAARARASLSLALVSFEHFYGLLRPSEGTAFQHTSILVRPRQKPRSRTGAGYVVEPPGTAPGSAAPIARYSLSP
jgi:hypothetical protein